MACVAALLAAAAAASDAAEAGSLLAAAILAALPTGLPRLGWLLPEALRAPALLAGPSPRSPLLLGALGALDLLLAATCGRLTGSLSRPHHLKLERVLGLGNAAGALVWAGGRSWMQAGGRWQPAGWAACMQGSCASIGAGDQPA
jgi:hypothetical protein